MKGIKLCAECADYDMKQHRCRRGAKDDPDPRAPFYADCPLDDVEPVRHGRWINIDGYDAWICSECNNDLAGYDENPVEYGVLYCNNCGAKMDKEAE